MRRRRSRRRKGRRSSRRRGSSSWRFGFSVISESIKAPLKKKSYKILAAGKKKYKEMMFYIAPR